MCPQTVSREFYRTRNKNKQTNKQMCYCQTNKQTDVLLSNKKTNKQMCYCQTNKQTDVLLSNKQTNKQMCYCQTRKQTNRCAIVKQKNIVNATHDFNSDTRAVPSASDAPKSTTGRGLPVQLSTA
jgi:hypothetical protein